MSKQLGLARKHLSSLLIADGGDVVIVLCTELEHYVKQQNTRFWVHVAEGVTQGFNHPNPQSQHDWFVVYVPVRKCFIAVSKLHIDKLEASCVAPLASLI